VIAGILAAITAIATMATAAVVFSQSIQSAHYINTLTQNVSYIFQQVAINEKIYICLNSLEAVLVAMGDEVQMLKFPQELLCHAGFQHTCVTAAPYNATDFPWKLVKPHVVGAWENNNDSLNLQALRQQILAMQ
jgi:hypothetical protein